MASSNNESAGLFWLVVLMLAVLYYVAVIVLTLAAFTALVLFALATFTALVLTVLALLAWNDDLHLGSLIIETDEARAFVYRGLLGALLMPLFIAFMAMLYGGTVDWAFLPYFLLAGYTLGSLGIVYLEYRDHGGRTNYAPYRAASTRALNATPSVPALPAPSAYGSPPPQSGPPFRFASWDDEAGA